MRRASLLTLAVAAACLAACIRGQPLAAQAGRLQRFGGDPAWNQGPPPHPPHAWERDAQDEADAAAAATPMPTAAAARAAPAAVPAATPPAGASMSALLGSNASPATATAPAAAAPAPATAAPKPAGQTLPTDPAVAPALVSASIELRGPEVAPWTPKAQEALLDGVAEMLMAPRETLSVVGVRELAPGPAAPAGRRALRQQTEEFAGTALTLTVATTAASAGPASERLLESTAGTGRLATALGTRGVQTKAAAVTRTETRLLPPPGSASAGGATAPSPRVSAKTATTAAVVVLTVSLTCVAIFMSIKRCVGGRDGGAVSAADSEKATGGAPPAGGAPVGEGKETDGDVPAAARGGAAAFFMKR
jgi:hypothetical protein